jgi:hypothetical protein
MAKNVKGRKKKTRAKSPIRDAIMAAVKKKEMTGYRLVEALRGKVSRTSVYRFLSNGGTTNVATAEAFFEILGLCVVEKK